MPPLTSRSPVYRARNRYRLALLAAAGIGWPAAAEQAGQRDCRPDPDGGRACAITTGSAAAGPANGSVAAPPLASRLGWVEKDRLSSEQQAQIAPGCCGAYLLPHQDADPGQDPADAEIVALSDRQQHRGDLITLEGNIEVTQGNRRLVSDHGVINQRTSEADFHGDIQLSEPGLLLQGYSAHLNAESNAVEIDNASFVFAEQGVRGTAAKLTRDSEQHYRLDEVTYTSCPPDSNSWQLVTSRIDVDTGKNEAAARNVRIEIKDLPVLYLPWISFPLGDDKKTGLLFPNFSIGGRNGLDFSQPYFINLAPNYDLTLTPRFIRERGGMIEAHFRHLSGWGQTGFTASYLGDDKGGDNENNSLEVTAGEDRWWRNLTHNGAIGHFTTGIDYTRVSDNLYIRDLGINTLADNSTTHLRQKIQLGYSTEYWDIALKGEQFQTVFQDPGSPAPEPYRQLPRLDINGAYPLGGGLTLNLAQHLVNFDHPDDSLPAGVRTRADWGLEWDTRWAWGFFSPGAEVHHLQYRLDDNASPVDDSPSVTAPAAWIDSGLFFERAGERFTQTLEPRLYLLYARREDQSQLSGIRLDTSEQTFGYHSLWRNDRFSGGDRIGDSKQASIGLTTRLLDDNGRERLRTSIGQIFYFEDRFTTLNGALDNGQIDNPLLLDGNGNGVVDESDGLNERTFNDFLALTRDKSPIAAELVWRLGNHWQLLGDSTWDQGRRRIDKGSLALRYNDGDNHIVNLGYRFTRGTARAAAGPTGPGFTITRDQTIEQGDISSIFPLRGNLSLIARWHYDFTNRRNLETFTGIEYNSCCWRASLVARRWIERDDLRRPAGSLEEDEGVFFRVQLKGFAGTSGKVDEILSESIYGYQTAEKRYERN